LFDESEDKNTENKIHKHWKKKKE